MWVDKLRAMALLSPVFVMALRSPVLVNDGPMLPNAKQRPYVPTPFPCPGVVNVLWMCRG